MSDSMGFQSLPEELYFLILSFLDHPQPLLNVAAVNWRLRRLVEDDSIWRALFASHNHERTPYEEVNGTSYKVLVKRRFVLGTYTLCCLISATDKRRSELAPLLDWKSSSIFRHTLGSTLWDIQPTKTNPSCRRDGWTRSCNGCIVCHGTRAGLRPQDT